MTKDDFYSHALIFLESLFQQLHEKSVELQSHWNLDHLCFRVNSVERYRHFFKAFHEWSDLLIESEVNGRPISTFKLHDPLNFRSRLIDLVELPAPKAGKVTQEGFEHIEVVCDVSFQEIKHRFSHQCAFNESGLQAQNFALIYMLRQQRHIKQLSQKNILQNSP